MNSQPVRVVKVGGSLLTFPPLAEALDQWLRVQTPARHVLIAGGGELADVIRAMDRRFDLGDEASHWLCIDALGITARLLATLLPHARRVTGLEALRQRLADRQQSEPIVFCPRRFMQREESAVAGAPLPHSWDATTDSIAARLAVAVVADELVLLKSADSPREPDAGSGYVDACFAAAAGRIPRVRIENLRRTAEDGPEAPSCLPV
jgi:aspartokinase-like uncharacterized kinase